MSDRFTYSFRIYFQSGSKKYEPTIYNCLKLHKHLNILPSVELSSNYTFENVNRTDFSVIIMAEHETFRVEQSEWFVQSIKQVVENTDRKLFVILFSNLSVMKAEEMREIYELCNSNVKCCYFNYRRTIMGDDTLHFDICNAVNNFILNTSDI